MHERGRESLEDETERNNMVVQVYCMVNRVSVEHVETREELCLYIWYL
jgi:hypothetical protein